MIETAAHAHRNHGPLHGVRVLDLTSVVMGPLATQILGDLGADVITIEAAKGETNRVMGTGPHPQLSGIALNLLRNKRNVALDLKSDDGRDAVLRIAATCDVFVTNLRPAPLGRLRLTYDDVRGGTARRRLLPGGRASRRTRPMADEPAYDDIVQAASGVADVVRRASGPDGEPALLPMILADKVSGLTLDYALLAALFERERSGLGQRIEVPMVDAVAAFVLVEHGAGRDRRAAAPPAGRVRAHPHAVAPAAAVGRRVGAGLPLHGRALRRAVRGGRAGRTWRPTIGCRPPRGRQANSELLYTTLAVDHLVADDGVVAVVLPRARHPRDRGGRPRRPRRRGCPIAEHPVGRPASGRAAAGPLLPHAGVGATGGAADRRAQPRRAGRGRALRDGGRRARGLRACFGRRVDRRARWRHRRRRSTC